MSTLTIFRIENPTTMHGMWYDQHGNFDPAIHRLCPNSPSKDLPMPECMDHNLNGKQWYSAGKSIDNMQHWFSREDAERLVSHGFRLYQFVVSEFQVKELEVLFTREGVVSQVEISIDKVWPKCSTTTL